MTEPTQMYCPESPGRPGEDGTTHHLVPSQHKEPVMRCRYCGQTEAQLREHGGVVKRTQDELVAALTERFGDDPKSWSFRCPRCGDIATSTDFKSAMEARDLPGFGSDRLGQECIGRLLGALSKEGVTPRGCDWAAYGLFRGPEFVILPDGREIPSFPVAQVSRG